MTATLLVAALAVALIALVVQRQRLLARLRLLARYVEAVADGEAEPALPPPPNGAGGEVQRRLVGAAEAARARFAVAYDAQRQLEEVLAGMVEGVLVVNASGTVLLGNRRAETLLDLPRDVASTGKRLIELTRHPDLHEFVREVVRDGDARHSFTRDLQFDGVKPQVLQVTATPMPVATDAARNFILVFHDVSETKRLERMRRDFVANVSHELRTPLTAIGGYAETLLGGALEDPQRARPFLSIIERHTVRLGRLVDDLLTLSDLELGRTELRRTAVHVDDVVETAFEVLRNKAVQGGITLAKAIGEDTPPLDADQDRVEQALVNLVDNAIKHTPAGGHVTVGAQTVATARTAEGLTLSSLHGFVEIAVSDTGIGVAADELPRLTERFYRVDKARSRELGGTGLGLAIVKHIVQAHHGSLWIESEVGRGTTVRLYLPRFVR